jgi:hypothetical protein
MSKQIKKEKVRGLSPANSAAASPGRWSVVFPKVRDVAEAPPRRKGPKPGTVDRYKAADRSLYPELKRLMSEQCLTVTAAARQLADDYKVAGIGAPESRARRLARRYTAETQ